MLSRQDYCKKEIPTFVIIALFVLPTLVFSADADHVIIVSVDGLRADAIAAIDVNGIPNLKELASGSATFNARTDYDYTNTLPNHAAMITSRRVPGIDGHNWTDNGEPCVTLHTNKGSYVASVFDVAHDNGLYTAMYAGKTKFSLFDTSYDATNGAVDTTGDDNGQDKIDTYQYSTDGALLTRAVIVDLNTHAASRSLIFLHYPHPDTSGHSNGWDLTPGSAYVNSIIAVDGYLGRIMAAIQTNAELNGRTALILTTDHGGNGTNHGDAKNPLNYTIPFLVWFCHDQEVGDLYDLNSSTRTDPDNSRPDNSATSQPIRNADVANLALDLLGLPAIPGSVNSVALEFGRPDCL